MLTTAGAARSTASAYELTCRAGSATAGTAATTGALTSAGAGGDAAWATGARRATSSGRTTTAMKAAASPTIADTAMKVTILRNGRVDMNRIILVGRRS